MRKLFPHIVLLLAGILAGCAAKEVLVPEKSGALEMKGVQAVIVDGTQTKAGTVTPLADYVGRKKFMGYDRIVFTRICRTGNPLDAFTYPGPGATYAGIVFQAGNEGGEAGGWQRQTDDGGPERIYWTDAASEHTFIAYGVPQDDAYDWKSHVHTVESTSKTYYIGSLGDPLATGDIDFSLTAEEQASHTAQENNVTVYKNPKLEKEDLVIAYDTHMQAEPGGSVALVQFYHALASVRVVVNISGFSSSSTAADNEAVVSDMVLLHQPTMYAWEQSDFGAQPLRSEDQAIIDGAWGEGDKPHFDQRKNIKLWIPRPAGSGSNQNKTFTFYGITTPQPQNYISTLGDTDVNRSAELSFNVTYPNPLKPSSTVTSTYKASLKDVCFDAGYNTTIHISLNHKNEKMTVGAEYENWQFVATPDVSELFKNSTFLQDTDRWVTGTDNIPNVTIMGDEKATADDATWLYQSGDKILDIYGHDGSSVENAYQISTAYQLLSFAYEVKAGRDFTGKFIRLDADLTLQKSSDKTKEELPTDDEAYSTAADAIAWIGIGESGKPFNGTFLGGDRYIYSLYGKPLFAELGPKAQILKLQVSTIQKADQSASVTGGGLLADSNAGLISACKMDGDVTLSGSPAGAFVGTNSGTVYASYHIGATNGSGTTGGLVGTNSGTVRNSYQVGKVTGSTTGGIAGENSGTLNTTYYNSSLLPSPTATFEGATGKSTLEMTMPGFVTALNIGIGEFEETAPDDLWSYVLRPADYPKIGDYVQLNGWLETDLHLITASDRFVIVGNNGSNYAMTNDNGDSASPLAQPVTVKDGAITGDVPSNLQWTLTSAEEVYSFHPFGYNAAYLYVSDLGGSNRNVNVREESDRGSFTIEDGFLKNTASSRFLGIYNSEEWRSYTSHTNKADNINSQMFKFYKFYADDKNAALTLAHPGKVSMGDAPFNLVITNPHNIPYTLTSADESIATVTPADQVTVKKAGTVTLTASWEEQASYRAGQYLYVLKIWKVTPTVSFAEPSVSIDWATTKELTQTATTTPSGVALTYSSNNPSVATVNASTGKVTALKRGTAVITATVADLANYESASASYTLNVTDTRSFAVDFSASEGGYTFTTEVDGSSITSGSFVEVGKVVKLSAKDSQDKYAIRLWKVTKTDDPGTEVVVAANRFEMPEYAVTITSVPGVFEKVTSVSEFASGGDYLIVYETGGKVLTGVSDSNIGTDGNVTILDSQISSIDADYNVAIAKVGDSYTMKMGDKYLAYTSTSTSGKNDLYAVDNSSVNGTLWNLSVDDAQNVYNTSRYLRYNSSNSRFCCYTSGQQKVSFYKLWKQTTWTLDRIAVSGTSSHKTSYIVGQSFDPAGLVIAATYKDAEDSATEKTVGLPYDAGSMTISPSGALAVGNTTVTVSYGGKTADIVITVSENTHTAVAAQNHTFSEKGYENSSTVSTITGTTNCSISFAKGSGQTNPTYYNDGSSVRAYGGNTITVTAATGYYIGKLTFTFGSDDGSNAITASTGTYSEGIWTGVIANGESVVFTIGGTSGNRRIRSISINPASPAP